MRVHTFRSDQLTDEDHDPGDIIQIHTAQDVQAGAYEGDVTVGDLRPLGHFGIGTLEGLDGELVVVDGEFWDIDVDGVARLAPDTARVPFAVLCDLVEATTIDVTGPLDRAGFEALVREHLPDPDGCYALRVEGRFAPVRFRSVARQHPPYRPLAEVLATDQHDFTVPELVGTMVGFCFPPDAGDLEFAGFHLHLLAADRSTGGHVFEADLHDARITLAHPHAVHVEL
nr:acetolactate decarboxylase [Rhabdothermincola salaria]